MCLRIAKERHRLNVSHILGLMFGCLPSFSVRLNACVSLCVLPTLRHRSIEKVREREEEMWHWEYAGGRGV